MIFLVTHFLFRLIIHRHCLLYTQETLGFSKGFDIGL